MDSFASRVQEIVSGCEGLNLIADTINPYEPIKLSDLHLGNNGIRGVLRTSIMTLEILHGSGIGHGGISLNCFVKGKDSLIKVIPPVKTDTDPNDDIRSLGILLSELLKKSEQRHTQPTSSKPPKAAYDLVGVLLSDTPPEMKSLLENNEWLKFDKPNDYNVRCKDDASISAELKKVSHGVATLQAQFHQVITPQRAATPSPPSPPPPPPPPPSYQSQAYDVWKTRSTTTPSTAAPFCESVSQIVETLGTVVDDAVFNITQTINPPVFERRTSDTRDRSEQEGGNVNISHCCIETDSVRQEYRRQSHPHQQVSPLSRRETMPIFDNNFQQSSPQDCTYPQLPQSDDLLFGRYQHQQQQYQNHSSPSHSRSVSRSRNDPSLSSYSSVPQLKSEPVASSNNNNVVDVDVDVDVELYSPISRIRRERERTQIIGTVSKETYSPIASQQRNQLNDTLPGDPLLFDNIAMNPSGYLFQPNTSIDSFLDNERRFSKITDRTIPPVECNISDLADSTNLTNKTDTSVVARQSIPIPYSDVLQLHTTEGNDSGSTSTGVVEPTKSTIVDQVPEMKNPVEDTDNRSAPSVSRESEGGGNTHSPSEANGKQTTGVKRIFANNPHTASASNVNKRDPPPINANTTDIIPMGVIPCLSYNTSNGDGEIKSCFDTLKHSHSSREVIERSVSESLISRRRDSSPVQSDKGHYMNENPSTGRSGVSSSERDSSQSAPKETNLINEGIACADTVGGPGRQPRKESCDVQIQCSENNDHIEVCHSPISEIRNNSYLSVSNMSSQCSLDMEPERLQFEERHHLSTILQSKGLQNMLSGNLQLAQSLQAHLKKLVYKNDRLRTDLLSIQRDQRLLNDP
eukprot:TRINITY_DN4673_c1_g3_i1.p1 TRINITY_DN4673_c1_g3~~TRINITY_DN4673_c1_g3_i1.p1  ORF type:complete len:859 (+),score=170.75 TRINITY_DN4673_c1_g3_i1:94-2670(+)